MKFYVVTFDRDPNAAYKAFHDAFTGDPRIKRYFHYIKSSYLIGTEMSAEQLSSHYTNTAQAHGLKTTHLVVAVDRSERFGLLPKDAWEWFRR